MVNYILRKAKNKVEYPLSPQHDRVTDGLILIQEFPRKSGGLY